MKITYIETILIRMPLKLDGAQPMASGEVKRDTYTVMVRIDTDGHSTSYAPGGPWFEAGPIPVFAQAAADRASRFIRVMVLPAGLKGKSSISYVNAEDRDKPKSQCYKIFVDQPIEV